MVSKFSTFNIRFTLSISRPILRISVRELLIKHDQKIQTTTFVVVLIFSKRGERMRQSARHIYVPHGNEVYVNNRRAWRIRRRTINNHSKTDMFNRVFVYGWFIVCQRAIAPTTLCHFAWSFGWQARKFKQHSKNYLITPQAIRIPPPPSATGSSL